MLQQSPIPPSSGFANMLVNRGGLENKGLEIGLDVTAIDKGDFNLSFGGNISFNKSKIENLGLVPGDILMSDGMGGYSNQQIASYLGNVPSRGNSIKFPINIFMEGHDDVDNALSDASTQWPIDKLENILTSIIAFRKTYLNHG